jgi:hypothetical protein
MVAKINLGNSLFGALSYNQEKVDAGEAKIIYSNLIAQTYSGEYTIPLSQRSFEHYLTVNKKTEDPVVHISLNPHPDDRLTDEQFREIAQEYLEKLGYGNQPCLVYKHEDIGRHHLHIVTTCVKEDGKRINGSYEHRRSKNITRELEKKYNLVPAEKKKAIDKIPLNRVNPEDGNIKGQVSNVVKSLIKDYRFQSINEFRALLSLYGITVEEVKGEVRGRTYHGIVYSALDKKGRKAGNPFKASLIGRDAGAKALQKKMAADKLKMKDKAACNRTKRIVSAILSKDLNRKDFRKELEKNGISVIFRENGDKRIYGVTFIDHHEKFVFNGSRMGKEFSANVFNDLWNNKQNGNTLDNDNPFNFSRNGYQEQESVINSIAGLFSMERHGDDYNEIAFTNRMKRKKRKRSGPKL